jgi:hypothetical protein
VFVLFINSTYFVSDDIAQPGSGSCLFRMQSSSVIRFFNVMDRDMNPSDFAFISSSIIISWTLRKTLGAIADGDADEHSIRENCPV